MAPLWTTGTLWYNGYTGWVHKKALLPCSEAEAQAYQRSLNAVVLAERLPVYAPQLDLKKARCRGLQHLISKLPFGVRVCVVEQSGDWSALQTPEGGRIWVRSSDLLPLRECPTPDAEGIALYAGINPALRRNPLPVGRAGALSVTIALG